MLVPQREKNKIKQIELHWLDGSVAVGGDDGVDPLLGTLHQFFCHGNRAEVLHLHVLHSFKQQVLHTIQLPGTDHHRVDDQAEIVKEVRERRVETQSRIVNVRLLQYTQDKGRMKITAFVFLLFFALNFIK